MINAKFVYLGCTKAYEYLFDDLKRESKCVYWCFDPHVRLSGALWWLHKLHNSPKVNKIFNVPFRGIWAKSIIDPETRNALSKDDRICFCFSALSYPLLKNNIIEYLKRRYPLCKTMCFLNDIASLYYDRFPDFSVEELKKKFDVVITYNPIDAEKYDLVLDRPRLYVFDDGSQTEEINNDVFFIGDNKDRIDEIHRIYSLLSGHGLKCDFSVINVPEEKQQYKGKIKYNSYLPYSEVVKAVKGSRAVLNIIQANSEGITLRDYEAIGMGKVLITNAKSIMYSDFYSPEMVIPLEDLEDNWERIPEYNGQSQWKNLDMYSQQKYYEWLEAIMFHD